MTLNRMCPEGCGIPLPPGTETGVTCDRCGTEFSPEDLREAGFRYHEWRGAWIEPSELME